MQTLPARFTLTLRDGSFVSSPTNTTTRNAALAAVFENGEFAPDVARLESFHGPLEIKPWQSKWKPPMDATKAAHEILMGLKNQELRYILDPARGEFRGFGALHDLCDANMRIPGADDDRNCAEGVIDLYVEWCNAVTAEFNRIALTIDLDRQYADGEPVQIREEWRSPRDTGSIRYIDGQPTTTPSGITLWRVVSPIGEKRGPLDPWAWTEARMIQPATK